MGRTDNVGRFFRARPWARCRAVAYSVARCRRCLGPRARPVSRIQCALGLRVSGSARYGPAVVDGQTWGIFRPRRKRALSVPFACMGDRQAPSENAKGNGLSEEFRRPESERVQLHEPLGRRFQN
jgi:hypothetical protein